MDEWQRTVSEPIGDGESEPDFAEEHDRLWVESDSRRDIGETESPRGHAGLEATMRPN